MNTLATFFCFNVFYKNWPFILSCINWNFVSIYFDLWWTTGFFAKTILDWLSQWIVRFLSDSNSIIVLNSALRCWASWLTNEIAINSASHVDKVTEFCFLDFHEIIGLCSADLKQNLLMLFLSLKLAQSTSQSPPNFKGFCNFLNIVLFI